MAALVGEPRVMTPEPSAGGGEAKNVGDGGADGDASREIGTWVATDRVCLGENGAP
jgi:hypothetical protein